MLKDHIRLQCFLKEEMRGLLQSQGSAKVKLLQRKRAMLATLDMTMDGMIYAYKKKSTDALVCDVGGSSGSYFTTCLQG